MNPVDDPMAEATNTKAAITKLLTRVFRFLIVGLPAFLIAIPLNWWLVEHLKFPEPAAYAIVLVIQVTINFFACILFVFERNQSQSLLSQFFAFFAGIIFVRFLDWSLYSLLVKITPIHFILLQIGNVLIFSVVKFLFAQRALEGKSLKSDMPKS